MSHSIRGRAGNAATDEVMIANNKKAIEVGTYVENNCPDLRIYVPGRMDKFLIDQGVTPIKVVDALLGLDCAIVGQSDILLVYIPDDYISGGMRIEIKHALCIEKDIIYFSDVSPETIKHLNTCINKLKEN